jgi:hypothetical protein
MSGGGSAGLSGSPEAQWAELTRAVPEAGEAWAQWRAEEPCRRAAEERHTAARHEPADQYVERGHARAHPADRDDRHNEQWGVSRRHDAVLRAELFDVRRQHELQELDGCLLE